MSNKHLFRALCLCLIVSLPLGCKPQTGVVSQRIIPLVPERFRPVHLEPSWYYDLELSPGEQIEQTWLAPKSIYLLSNLNKLYRLDRDRGIVTWIVQPAEPNYLVRQPAESQDKTLVVAYDHVKLYDLRTGQLIKEIPLDFTVSSDPAFDGERFYVGDSIDRVVAVELESGLRLWTCRADGAFSAQPALSDSMLVSVSESGEVLAYDSQTGSPFWPDHFRTRGPLLVPATLTLEFCYVAGTDSMLYCLRNGGGDEIWRYFAGKGLRTAPVVTDQRVFLTVPSKGMVTLNALTGSELEGFQFPDGKKYVGRVDDRLYILIDRGRMISANAETGQRLAEIKVPDFDFFLSDEKDHRIYLANAEGRIVCLHQLGAGLLQRQSAKSPER